MNALLHSGRAVYYMYAAVIPCFRNARIVVVDYCFMCVWFSYFRKFICIHWIYMLEFNLTGHRLSLLHSTFFRVVIVVVSAGCTINAFSSHSLDALVCTGRRKNASHAISGLPVAWDCHNATRFHLAADGIGAKSRDAQKTNENLVLLCGLIHNNKMYNIESNDCDTYSRSSPEFR